MQFSLKLVSPAKSFSDLRLVPRRLVKRGSTVWGFETLFCVWILAIRDSWQPVILSAMQDTYHSRSFRTDQLECWPLTLSYTVLNKSRVSLNSKLSCYWKKNKVYSKLLLKHSTFSWFLIISLPKYKWGKRESLICIQVVF